MDGANVVQALTIDPNLNGEQVDIPQEWERYFRRQNLLASIVKGEMHPDDLLDCMLEDGISPDDYLEEVEFALAGVL